MTEQPPAAPEKKENRKPLDPLAYKVTQEGATEPAGTGKWLHNKETGAYHCIVCDAPLYRSDDKFDSGSGWPSFTQEIKGAVERKKDTSHGMVRTEIVCAKCDAHLGHVFDDGPGPKGERHCTNSVALDFHKTTSG